MNKIEDSYTLAQFAKRHGVDISCEQAEMLMTYGLGVWESLYELDGKLYIAEPKYIDFKDLLTKAKNHSYYSLISSELTKNQDRYDEIASDSRILEKIDIL